MSESVHPADKQVNDGVDISIGNTAVMTIPSTHSRHTDAAGPNKTLHIPKAVVNAWVATVYVFNTGATTRRELPQAVGSHHRIRLRALLRRWAETSATVGFWKDGNWALASFDDEVVVVQDLPIMLVRVGNWDRVCKNFGNIIGRYDSTRRGNAVLDVVEYRGWYEMMSIINYTVVVWTKNVDGGPSLCHMNSQVGKTFSDVIQHCKRLNAAIDLSEDVMTWCSKTSTWISRTVHDQVTDADSHMLLIRSALNTDAWGCGPFIDRLEREERDRLARRNVD
ncbi:uncharacterized protein BXZ73DRAFT_83057 [Epithele typhae]|uniref:uncharacterized protein n=1 Tax=Epithele typhae TaxID=378194 RepID=UPI002008E177|nr:uncharacterized protein BXZ73DRAFT_83057 [Epithele typhae]KAH9910920.1 hypothetical protein BXZ73DRAFT_83057 [Epithele typhae]